MKFPVKAELTRLEIELGRYGEAIADARAVDTILQAIKVCEERRESIRRELNTLAPQRAREKDAH